MGVEDHAAPLAHPVAQPRSPKMKVKLSAYRFKELVKHTVKGRTSASQHAFSAHDYASFWQSLQLNPALCAFFFKQLVTSFLDTFERVRKALKPGKQRQSYDGSRNKNSHLMFHLRALLHTIDYLSLFYILDPAQKTFGDAIDKFENYQRMLTSKNRVIQDESCQEVWQQVCSVLSRTRRKAMEKVEAIDLIVLDCTFVYSLAKIESHLPSSFSVLRDFPFLPSKVRRIFQDPALVKERYTVFLAITRFLQKIHVQLVQNPAIAVKPLGNIMSISVLLSMLLSAYPLKDTYMLGKIRKIVDEFVRWPQPFSSYFQRLSDLLAAEELNPGSAREAWMRERFPSLCVGPGSASENMDTKLFVEWSNAQGTVMVFSDQWINRCNLLQYIIGAGDTFSNLQEAIQDYKTRFILLTLDRDKAKIQSKLESASARRISRWYKELIEKQQTPHRSSRAKLKSVEGSETKANAGLWKHVLVPPPENIFDLGVNSGHYQTMAVEDSPQSTEKVPIDSLLRPGIGKYVDPGRDKARLLGLLRRAMAPAGSSAASKFRIVVLGSNRAIHRLLCALVSLRLSYPDVYKSVDVQVFVVPVGRNDVAGFLGLHDGWYRRHVFVPFSGPLVICPQLSVRSKQESFSKETPVVGPCGKYRETLQNYVSNAHENVPIAVFDCECWINSDVMDTHTADEEPYVKIPFCCRAELGVKAAAARFASVEAISGAGKTVDKDDDCNQGYGKLIPELAQVLLDRNFVRTGVGPGLTGNMCIHYSMEETGLPKVKSGALDENSYASISISNCPAYTLPTKKNDFRVEAEVFSRKNSVANPTTDSLEMSILPCSSTLSELLKKKDKRAKEVEAVCDAMANEAVTYHCNIVEIVAKEKPFDIALDDQIYGPFFKIRIKRTKLGDAKYSLPMKVFTPIHS